MHAFDVLGDPVRRRILELIVDGEEPAGTIASSITDEFGISQPAVSQHLRVLREHDFVTVRPEGTRRLYAIDPRGPRAASEWLSPFERFWRGPLAALDTELARGRRQRRRRTPPATPTGGGPTAASDDPGAAAAGIPHPRDEERSWST